MSQEDRDKWNTRYGETTGSEPGHPLRDLQPPHPFVVAQAGLLPRGGTALDVAGGVGRHAIWLAALGLDTTLLDISHLALERGQNFARERAVPLRVLEHDAADDGMPPGVWDVIVCSYFLRRELFGEFAAHLSPGGLLIFVHATAKNLERHARPPREFLLADDELPQLVTGLEIVISHEGWFGGGDSTANDTCASGGPRQESQVHEAHLVARKPG